ncbi:MAG: Rpn family recombination-promoting nuclease/putative transposase [Spirochaetales bacterium]|jgi:predicted transposase/invertase (TIGR01784 family)|nr:Rpn family recombination-promoting nuclease/putative transposase [Spirochaetales bacterium]
MHTIQFAPGDDIIEICRDNVFKAVFTRDTPLSQGALKRLISPYIGREVEVITVIANEPAALDTRDRQIRYDIRVKLDKGELANVEMTLFPRKFEPLRLEYYTARLFSGQEIRGSDKSFGELTHTYQISLIRSRRIFPDQALVHHFEYYDRELGVNLGGQTKIIVVELEKAVDIAGKPVAELSREEMWALFFRYAKDRERRALVNELLRREEGIAMAGEVLLTVSRDEIERARLDSEYEGRLDRQAERADARQEGWKERDEKALQEKLESGRKMKKDGLSPEQIQKYIPLSSEEIERL